MLSSRKLWPKSQARQGRSTLSARSAARASDSTEDYLYDNQGRRWIKPKPLDHAATWQSLKARYAPHLLAQSEDLDETTTRRDQGRRAQHQDEEGAAATEPGQEPNSPTGSIPKQKQKQCSNDTPDKEQVRKNKGKARASEAQDQAEDDNDILGEHAEALEAATPAFDRMGQRIDAMEAEIPDQDQGEDDNDILGEHAEALKAAMSAFKRMGRRIDAMVAEIPDQLYEALNGLRQELKDLKVKNDDLAKELDRRFLLMAENVMSLVETGIVDLQQSFQKHSAKVNTHIDKLNQTIETTNQQRTENIKVTRALLQKIETAKETSGPRSVESEFPDSPSQSPSAGSLGGYTGRQQSEDSQASGGEGEGEEEEGEEQVDEQVRLTEEQNRSKAKDPGQNDNPLRHTEKTGSDQQVSEDQSLAQGQTRTKSTTWKDENGIVFHPDSSKQAAKASQGQASSGSDASTSASTSESTSSIDAGTSESTGSTDGTSSDDQNDRKSAETDSDYVPTEESSGNSSGGNSESGSPLGDSENDFFRKKDQETDF